MELRKPFSPKLAFILVSLRRYFLYLLAAASLAVLAWAAWAMTRYPDDGLDLSAATGLVSSVHPDGPAAGRISPGDRLDSIDGVPFTGAPRLAGRHPGEVVTYLLYPTGQEGNSPDSGGYKVKLTLASPSPALLWERLSPLLVAFSFWLVGTLVLALSRPEGQALLFFWFCQGITAILGFGSLTTLGVSANSLFFGFLLWWIGPLAVQMHLAFSGLAQRWRRHSYYLYLPALVFSMAFLYTYRPLQDTWLAPTGSYLWLGGDLLAAALIPFIAYRRTTLVETRRKLGILGLAALAGFLPFLLFSLLPDALFGHSYIPYQTTFLALPALPLGYGYAILRYRLLHLEKYVNRSAAYVLAGIALGAVYGLVYLALPELLPGKDRRLSALGLAAIVVLIFLAHPLYLLFQDLVNRIFYGGWYDDRAAVRQISLALTQAEGDAAGIARTLCRALERTMQLEYANLLLSDGLLATSTHPGGRAAVHITHQEGAPVRQALDALYEAKGREIGGVQELDGFLPLSLVERRQVLGARPQLWLLLRGSLGPLGLLILGYRRGGEFDGRDLEILEVVVHQARAALESAALLREVQRHAGKIRQLHRQVLQSREDERKRVARELHDRTIQALVGLNYGLARVRGGAQDGTALELTKLQGEVRAILDDVRQVCADLRPPALDTLGLIPALQTRVAELEAGAPFEISLRVVGDEDQEIPEGISLCLYRVFQEALANVGKHAGASRVTVEVSVSPEAAGLCVQDDGRGCDLPDPLGTLAQEKHFGLVGLQELVEAVQGRLEIRSASGQGCRLEATIPLDPAHSSTDSGESGMGRGRAPTSVEKDYPVKRQNPRSSA